jgi:hypothetical protein
LKNLFFSFIHCEQLSIVGYIFCRLTISPRQHFITTVTSLQFPDRKGLDMFSSKLVSFFFISIEISVLECMKEKMKSFFNNMLRRDEVDLLFRNDISIHLFDSACSLCFFSEYILRFLKYMVRQSNLFSYCILPMLLVYLVIIEGFMSG